MVMTRGLLHDIETGVGFDEEDIGVQSRRTEVVGTSPINAILGCLVLVVHKSMVHQNMAASSATGQNFPLVDHRGTQHNQHYKTCKD